MQTPAFYDGASATVTTAMPDGSIARIPLGDFLDSQRRIAHALRRAAIDAAIDNLQRRLREYRRSAPRLSAELQSQA